MARKTSIGTCSNCRENAGVIRARGVQLCQLCIGKLRIPPNIKAFCGQPYREPVLKEQG